jgi:hypothetical protein
MKPKSKPRFEKFNRLRCTCREERPAGLGARLLLTAINGRKTSESCRGKPSSSNIIHSDVVYLNTRETSQEQGPNMDLDNATGSMYTFDPVTGTGIERANPRIQRKVHARTEKRKKKKEKSSMPAKFSLGVCKELCTLNEDKYSPEWYQTR